MTRSVHGMHLPNQGMWHIEQMLRIGKTDGAVTLLHFLLFPRDTMSDNAGDVENDYWYAKLRWGWPAQGIPPAPKRLIHIRLYQAQWDDWDPKEVARRAVSLLSGWTNAAHTRSADLWADPFVCVSPCNEQNLEGRDKHNYAAHAEWQLRFWDEVDRLKPDRKALSCLGAWAFGHDVIPDVPDSEYAVPKVRELCERVDILATHPYANFSRPGGGLETADPERDGYWHLLRDFRPEGWRDSRQAGRPHDIGGILAQVPGKPLLITESGTFVHGDEARTPETLAAMRLLLEYAAASGRVLGVTWFIWNSGPEHAGNRIWYNEGLRDGMEALPDLRTTCEVPKKGQAPDGGAKVDTLGIDVSHWQGVMDWPQAARAGVKFAFVKATEGAGFVDGQVQMNARGALENGILVGPYHYYKHGVSNASQVQQFLEYCFKHAWTLPPAIDCEDGVERVDGEKLRQFCEAVASRYRRPIIYTAAWWWNNARFGGPQAWAHLYPLWCADYSGSVQIPSDWAGVGYAIHQYTSKGDGPKYGADSKYIDLNTSPLTVAQLAALTEPIVPVPVPGFDLAGLLEAARIEHTLRGIRVNPLAALVRAIRADGRVPVTNEFEFSDARIPAQVGEALDQSGAHVYWWSGGNVSKAAL